MLDPGEGRTELHIVAALFSISRFQIRQWMSVIALLTIFILPASSLSDEEEDKCCCTTFDTGQCLIKVRKNVDAKLNDTYQRALKKWADDPSVIAKLKNAERAWIKYRDANCEGEYQTYGRGTIGPNMSAFCQIRLTRQRIQEIAVIYLQEH